MQKIEFSPSEMALLIASDNNMEGDALEWDSPPLSAVIKESGLEEEVATQALQSLLEKGIIKESDYREGLFHYSIRGVEYALFATGWQSRESLEKMLSFRDQEESAEK